MRKLWICWFVVLALAVNVFGVRKTWRENPVVTVFRESVGLSLNKLFRHADNYFDREEDIALVKAVAKGNPDKIEKCIQNGGNVNAVGREGFTPLLWAHTKSSKKGFVYLLQHGADPNLVTTRYDDDKMSIMEEITTFRETDYLSLALENGASSDSPSGESRTILFRAIMFSNLKNVKVLVEAGANINHQDTGDQTPVMTAFAICRWDMVYYLLSAGADPTLKNIWGYDLTKAIQLDGFTIGDKKDYQDYLMVLKKLGIREDEVWKRGQPRESFFIPQKFEDGVWVGHE